MSPNPAAAVATRAPVWLTSQQRSLLLAAVTDAISNPQVGASLWRHLVAVASELQVADARDRVWPTNNALFRRASGYPADAVPVWITAEETAAVLATATDLPVALCRRLSPTAKT
jgi:hypothetical protein